MAHEQPFTILAEAVADGRPLDWGSLRESNQDGIDAGALAALSQVAEISDLFASLARSTGGSGWPPARLEPGDEWGGLRIVQHVGAGRFGDVYKAWDPALERHVALKLVACDVTAGAPTPVVDEGRLMARIRHSNVVAIYGAQRIGDVAGLSMEFIEGRTLEERLSTAGPSTADEIARIGRDLAEALGAVHAAGLVHRDVKASNVLCEASGRTVLGDFGTGQDFQTEAAGALAGTPAYVAPEVFAGAPASARSDVYSLGVLLFHIATGEYPHAARTLRDLRDAHERQTPRSLREARPDLPAPLSAIVDRALDRDPARRFASGGDVARAFVARREIDDRRRRTRVRLAGALAATAAVLAALWLGWAMRPAPFQFEERDWVLVAAFENRTGNPVFDGAVEYALAQELGSSPVVNVVPRTRIQDTLALMRRPLDDRVDVQTGREIALRDGGIRVVLAGQVDSSGTGYRLTIQILKPADGAMVASVTEPAAGDEDVLAAVGRLASKVRTRLGETPPPAGQDMPRVTTRSLKALALYQQALPDLFNDANPRVAEQLLAEAVREDPDFAAAHVGLARAIWVQRHSVPVDQPSEFRSSEIDAHLAEAARAATDVSVEERYRVTAEAGILTIGRVSDPAGRAAGRQQVLTALEALHRLRPDDEWVLHTLLERGDSRPARVKPLVERLVSLRPNSPYALVRAAWAMALTGDYEQARFYMARARPLLDLPTAERSGDRTAVNGRSILFDDAWVRDDVHEAAVLAEELYAIWRRSSPEAAALNGELMALKFLALGQLDRAEEIASSLIRNDGLRQLILASVAGSRKDPASARRYLDENGINASFRNSWAFVPIFALAGRLADAQAAVALMRTAPQVPPDFKATHEAQLALAEGQAERAIALLAPIVENDPGVVRSNDLADAWLARGSAEEAIRVLERVPPRRYGPLTPPHHWLAHQDRLARLYRQVGRTADADRVDARLRVLLTFADNDHPIVRRLAALGDR